MVFVKDFKKDFYDVVQQQKHVLMLVGCDVDALCACKILQYLFHCDHVQHTIFPVSTKKELEEGFQQNYEGVQYVILLNCGANLDIIRMLQPPDHMVFFICDSHRPIDIHNIYNQVQVKLLMKESEQEKIPAFEDVFRDDEDDDEDDNSDEHKSDYNDSEDEDNETREPPGKRRRFDEGVFERRERHKIWDENRDAILVEYTEFSSHGTSAALQFYELAWKLSKDTNDLLWWAVIAVTDQYVNHRVDRDMYIESIDRLQPHVSRLNHRTDNSENTVSINCLKISFDQELQLVLYRHWSLLESIFHSKYIACKFVVWAIKGKKRLKEFLADMGLPLAQCEQKFVCMDHALKDTVKEIFSKYAEKYGISIQELFLPSFHAQYGYRNKCCAEDVVHSCEAILQVMDKESTLSGNFYQALDILNRHNTKEMSQGLELAKLHLKTLVAQVQAFLEMKQIVSAGPFFYCFVQEGSPDSNIFASPAYLTQLAKFTLEAYWASTKIKKAKTSPMVMGVHLGAERGSVLLVGVAPISDKSEKNCFGKAFEQAAISSGSQMLQEFFDSNIVELKIEDRSKFFDTLTALLQN